MMKLNKHWKAHCNLLLSASGLVLISIAGCGGGGGGSKKATAPVIAPTNIPSGEGQPTPTPTLTPTPAPTATPRPDGSCPLDPNSYQPNYAGPLLAGFTGPDGNVQPPGQLLRHVGFPLRIFFNMDSEFTQARKTTALDAFAQWTTGTGGRVKFNVVTDKKMADLVVTFSPYDASDMGVLGLTTLIWDPTTNILFEYFQDTRTDAGLTDGDRPGHILLNQTNNFRIDTATAAHEFGHALGIGGHSPSEQDRMYYAIDDAPPPALSVSDINTLRTAYCDNISPLAARRSNRIGIGNARTLKIRDTYKTLGFAAPAYVTSKRQK